MYRSTPKPASLFAKASTEQLSPPRIWAKHSEAPAKQSADAGEEDVAGRSGSGTRSGGRSVDTANAGGGEDVVVGTARTKRRANEDTTSKKVDGLFVL